MLSPYPKGQYSEGQSRGTGPTLFLLPSGLRREAGEGQSPCSQIWRKWRGARLGNFFFFFLWRQAGSTYSGQWPLLVLCSRVILDGVLGVICSIGDLNPSHKPYTISKIKFFKVLVHTQ